MYSRPYWLREKMFYHLYFHRQSAYVNLFDEAELEFAEQISMKLQPGDAVHGPIAFTGFYELRLSRKIVKIARRKGGILVDVGANYGYYSCMWAAQSSGCESIAIEASPRNIPCLRENVSRNSLSARIDVIGHALGNENKPVTFWEGPQNQTGMGGFAPENEAHVEVECKRLDSLLEGKGIAEITVLKIDVEGADTWVLEGARGLLERRAIRHIFFEHDPNHLSRLDIDPHKAANLLTDCGYRILKINANQIHAKRAN